MLALDDKLIQGLQERNADRKRATAGGTHPRKPVPPVRAKDLHATERGLGFKIPELLRAAYTKVGAGGFGPGYGIIGGKGALQCCYEVMLEHQEQNAVWRWPRRLLPVADYGCGMYSCVDCEYKTLPMILWDPNNLGEDLGGSEARRNWGNAFWDQGLSLRTWFEGWLEGRGEPEPKWPFDSWMRRRLGFAWPRE